MVTLSRWRVQYIPEGDHDANGLGTFEAETLADVEAVLHRDIRHSIMWAAEPVESPAGGGWIEWRRRNLWYCTKNTACRVTSRNLRDAASLLRDPAFRALLSANAMGGDRSAPWALVHAGFGAEQLDGYALACAQVAVAVGGQAPFVITLSNLSPKARRVLARGATFMEYDPCASGAIVPPDRHLPRPLRLPQSPTVEEFIAALEERADVLDDPTCTKGPPMARGVWADGIATLLDAERP